jgi:hypothetical protein
MNAADLPGPHLEIGIMLAAFVEFSKPLMQMYRFMR